MKWVDYPEIVIDAFPKLYEQSTKVLITHLYNADKELNVPPSQFCKMYTTRMLANQLLCFLSERHVKISQNDFHIVDIFQPFRLRLSDGTRLEAMLCEGNELGTTHVLLIRREGHDKEPLLCFYSAVHQYQPHQLVRQEIFTDWVRYGTARLFLNLQNASEPWQPANFNKIAEKLNYPGNRVGIKLPIFGYEYLVQQLAGRLRKRIALVGLTARLYRFVNADFTHLATDEQSSCTVFSSSISSVGVALKVLPLSDLDWSPVPRRDNLMLFCSLLRPNHINGIIKTKQQELHCVPRHLYEFTREYEKKRKASDTVAQHLQDASIRSEADGESQQFLLPTATQTENRAALQSADLQNFRRIKRTNLQYIDDSTQDDSD